MISAIPPPDFLCHLLTVNMLYFPLFKSNELIQISSSWLFLIHVSVMRVTCQVGIPLLFHE